MIIVVDESVSYSVVEMLKNEGYKVLAIAENPTSGMLDDELYTIVVQKKALLVTRDHHFRNHLRFPPGKTAGVLYIRHGNIKASEEVQLVKNFFTTYKRSEYSGRLVTLYWEGVKIQ